MPKIHPSALVDTAATIADDVEIGPFCIVGPHVTIGAGSRLISHVSIVGHTTLGERATVYPFASLGAAPQSLAYRDEPTQLVIGSDCIIRESVTMSLGTAAGGGVTRVGNHNFVMAYAHVGHDCIVGDHVVFANGTQIGGHCEIGDHVFFGALAGVHQFTRIGAHAMIGAISAVSSDVIPFGMVSGERARMIGVNMVGMKRRKFSAESIRAVRAVYRQLFITAPTLEAGMEISTRDFGDDAAARSILDFVQGRGSRRICRPGG